MSWDAFISHASEDKDDFVRPLVLRLKGLGLKVWFDEAELKPGDSLSEKVAEGLAKSDCGLLVISPAFITRQWPAYELRGLITLHVNDELRLIPMWLDVTSKDVRRLNPSLADVFAIKAKRQDVELCALQILKVLRPSVYEQLLWLVYRTGNSRSVEIKKVRLDQIDAGSLKAGPVRHKHLPQAMLIRIKNVHFALKDALDIPLKHTVDNFKRDMQPDKELETWERIVAAYNIVCGRLRNPEKKTKKEVLTVVLSLSMGAGESLVERVEQGKLQMKLVNYGVDAWKEVHKD